LMRILKPREMKTLLFIPFLILSTILTAQSNFSVMAPAPNLSVAGFPLAPNATSSDAFHRCVFLIHRYELLPVSQGTINSVSLQITSGTGSIPVTGSFTLYLENSADGIMNKGWTWSSISAPMTPAFIGTMTIPANGPALIPLTLTAPFKYTGQSLYVGFNWASTGPFANTSAGFACNGAMNALGYTGDVYWLYSVSTSAAPSASMSGVFPIRPSLIFSGVTNVANDLEVLDLEAPGHLATSVNSQTVYSTIANTGTTTASNVTLSLKASGSNTFNTTQVIPSIAPGSTALAGFTGYNPQVNGLSTMTVSILNADQNLANNSIQGQQLLSCDLVSHAPPGLFFVGNVGPWFTGIVATKHTLSASVGVKGVDLRVGWGNVTAGQNMYAVIADQAGNILATGVTTSISPGTTVHLPFGSTQMLTAGTTYYIGAAQLTSFTYPFACAINNTFAPEAYYELPLAGGTPVILSNSFGLYLDLKAVLDKPTPFVSVSSNTAVCSGTPLTLTVAANGTYTWSANSTNSSVVVYPTTLTDYSVYAQNSNCIDMRKITVNVIPLPAVSIKGATTACKGSFVTATVTPKGGLFTGAANSTGLVTTAQAGTVQSYYTVKNTATGCSNTATLSTIVVSCTGLADNEQSSFNVYPNPATQAFTIASGRDLELKMTNQLGQVIATFTVRAFEDHKVMVDGLPEGIYFLTGDEGMTVKKIIVQN
jgi:hypothetical protein